MLWLSIALVLIFVLYLIDKHNIWKATAKIIGGLVLLLVLIAVGVYCWYKYDIWKTARAAKAQHEAAVQSCIADNRKADRDRAIEEIKSDCEANPDIVWDARQPRAESFLCSKDGQGILYFDPSLKPWGKYAHEQRCNSLQPHQALSHDDELLFTIGNLPSSDPSVPYQPVVHAPPGYKVQGAVCWKDDKGKLHYGDVFDELAAKNNSLDTQGCPSLKAGESLMPLKKN